MVSVLHKLKTKYRRWIRYRRHMKRDFTKATFDDDLDDIGDLMTIDEFLESCRLKLFINYDGFGYMVKGDKMDGEFSVYPSDFLSGNYDPVTTHVMWYNR